MSMLLTELGAKGLEVMTETVPQVRRIGILWNPTNPSHPRALKAIEAAGEKLGVELRMVPAQTLEDFNAYVGPRQWRTTAPQNSKPTPAS
jgi:putative ABC transport system substrate-binding protein